MRVGAAMAGVGLAAAVTPDAFILRTALVPAVMHLPGRSNRWLPAGLDKRLPHLAVEPTEDGPEPGGTEPGGPKTPPAIPAQRGGPSSVVRGFVRTLDGDPVEDAAVTLTTSGGRQLDRVVSHADGAYSVAVPAPGTYLLAATATSLGSRAVHVTVGDGPLMHDVELAPGGVDAVS